MKLRNFFTIAAVSSLLVSPCLADEITVGEFKFTLPANWTSKAPPEVIKHYQAVRIDPESGKPNAALIARLVTNTLQSESEQMVDLAKKLPEVIKLTEDRELELKGGKKGYVVGLESVADTSPFGMKAPTVTHSILLPTADGKAVAIKLQCGKPDLERLKKEFEGAVLADFAAKPPGGNAAPAKEK